MPDCCQAATPYLAHLPRNTGLCSPRTCTYIVRQGDALTAIAARTLGEGNR
jgi:hypothetical protein